MAVKGEPFILNVKKEHCQVSDDTKHTRRVGCSGPFKCESIIQYRRVFKILKVEIPDTSFGLNNNEKHYDYSIRSFKAYT